MSYSKIWVHAVWGTKGRQPVLANGFRQTLLDHFIDQGMKSGVEIELVNCWVDHVHCLLRLRPDQDIASVVKKMKREASQWINLQHLSGKRFSWSGDFYAASVSEGNLNGVKFYITSQERHHAHRTYREEIAAYFEHQK
jgi:putative transposase